MSAASQGGPCKAITPLRPQPVRMFATVAGVLAVTVGIPVICQVWKGLPHPRNSLFNRLLHATHPVKYLVYSNTHRASGVSRNFG